MKRFKMIVTLVELDESNNVLQDHAIAEQTYEEVTEGGGDFADFLVQAEDNLARELDFFDGTAGFDIYRPDFAFRDSDANP